MIVLIQLLYELAGMNEQGTDPSLHSHITETDPTTQKVRHKIF